MFLREYGCYHEKWKEKFSKHAAISSLIVISVCAALFIMSLQIKPVSAFSGGSGTSGDPYQIANWHDLNDVRNYSDKYFILIADLDSTTEGYSTYNSGNGWDPIATFTGEFNGNGHKIEDLYINRSGTNNVGLFGQPSGVIKNLRLENINITCGSYSGGLVGCLVSGGVVDNCGVTGVMNTGIYHTGGLAGRNQNSYIYNSFASVDVTSTGGGGHSIGGLIGWNQNGTVENCYATGDVSINSVNVGGLIGQIEGGTVKNCYATGDVSNTTNYAGGLIGCGQGVIENCYFAGTVSSSGDYVGGIVGELNSGSINSCSVNGSITLTGSDKCKIGLIIGHAVGITIENCHASGTIDAGNNSQVGGICGHQESGRIENCSANVTITGSGNAYGGLVGLPWSEIYNSYSLGQVEGTDDIGGLVGYTEGGAKIVNCYSGASVQGNSRVGGLVGAFRSGTSDTAYYSYAYGPVSGSSNVGGLIGLNEGNTVVSCFWDKDTTGQSSSSGGGTGKTTAEMMDITTFSSAGWDIATIETWDGENWRIDDGNDYPRLGWEEIPNSKPNKPANLQPSNAQINTSVMLSALVTDNNGDNMNVFFYDNTGGTPVLIDNVWAENGTYAQVTWSGLARGVTYRFFVACYDGSLWSDNSDPQSFHVANIVPVSPANGKMTNENVLTFTWENSTVFDNYELWIDNDHSFGSPTYRKDGILENYHVTENQLPDENYAWKVRGYLNGEYMESSSRTFIVDTVKPTTPVLLLPADGSGTDDRTPTFDWYDASDNTEVTSDVSGIENYTIQICSDNSFSSPEIEENVSTSAYTPGSNLAWGVHWWRVKAWDKAGNGGNWSEPRSVRILSYSISASNKSLEIMRGTQAGVTISVDLISGEKENVTLTGSWYGTAPSGVTASFSVSNAEMDFTSTLSFDVSVTASQGSFTYIVTGTTDSGLSTTENITVTITGLIFSLASSSSSVELMRGDSANVRLTVDFLWGSPSTVNLTGGWSGSAPSALTATLSRTSGTPPFTANLTFTTNENTVAGTYTYIVTATSGITRTVEISVLIVTDMSLEIETDRENYSKGQYVRISGTALNPKGAQAADGTVAIRLTCENWSLSRTATISGGRYSLSHFINFDQPEGSWIITATAFDNRGNVTPAPVSKTITVTQPNNLKFYTVTLLSPVPGTLIRRGDSVQITVEVREDGMAVQGASVFFKTADGRSVMLNEVSAGVYSVLYTVGWGERIGEWLLCVTGIKDLGGYFRGGCAINVMEVAPAQVNLQLLSPSGDVEVGQAVVVRVRARYPDGSALEQGRLVVTTPGGESLVLLHEGGGEYAGTYVVKEGDVGAWQLEVTGMDAHGNSGGASATVAVRPTSIGGYIVQYWWTVACAVALACAAATPFGIKRARISKLRSVSRERKRIEELKQEAAIEYFVKRKIKRETYENMLNEYEVRLSKLNKKEMELKWKLKMD
ncbi:MAG: GLUG motif-containing protein [Candidatus Hadarchaeales archaeon]